MTSIGLRLAFFFFAGAIQLRHRGARKVSNRITRLVIFSGSLFEEVAPSNACPHNSLQIFAT
jgi:hypothetical protein